MKNKVVKRNKAFIGAIIGAVGNIVGSAISAKKKKKAEEQAFKMQQEEQYRQDSLAAAQAMTQSYANQDYVDEYKKKVVLKNGGKMKTKQSNYTDRIKNQKKYACGGRKKADFGSTIANQFSGNNLNDSVGGIASGIGSIASSLINGPSAPKMIKKADGFNYEQKTSLTPNSYSTTQPVIQPVTQNVNQQVPNNNQYSDRLAQMKLGGCKGKKKRK